LKEHATIGQSAAPPLIGDLERLGAGEEVRGPIGELLYAVRGTRPELAWAVSQLGRFVERWHADPWMDKELRHVLGYVKRTCHYGLRFVSMGDLWEDLWVVIWADGNLTVPRSHGGFFIALVGTLGTFLPLLWRSWTLSHATSSSAESETLVWGEAAKAGISLAAVVEATRRRPIEVLGLVDAEALRLAVKRGSSTKMAHLRRSAGLSLAWLHDCGIVLNHVPGVDNVADVFTKNLGEQRLLHLVQRWYGLIGGRAATREEKKLFAAKAARLVPVHDSWCSRDPCSCMEEGWVASELMEIHGEVTNDALEEALRKLEIVT